VSESVYFAKASWLKTAEEAFRDIHSSAEPSVFSLDNLLLSIANDSRASLDVLQLVRLHYTKFYMSFFLYAILQSKPLARRGKLVKPIRQAHSFRLQTMIVRTTDNKSTRN